MCAEKTKKAIQIPDFAEWLEYFAGEALMYDGTRRQILKVHKSEASSVDSIESGIELYLGLDGVLELVPIALPFGAVSVNVLDLKRRYNEFYNQRAYAWLSFANYLRNYSSEVCGVEVLRFDFYEVTAEPCISIEFVDKIPGKDCRIVRLMASHPYLVLKHSNGDHFIDIVGAYLYWLASNEIKLQCYHDLILVDNIFLRTILKKKISKFPVESRNVWMDLWPGANHAGGAYPVIKTRMDTSNQIPQLKLIVMYESADNQV